MKKVYKISFILLILLTIFSNLYEVNAGEIWESAKDFLQAGADYIGIFEESTGEASGFLLGVQSIFFGRDPNGNKTGLSVFIDTIWGIGLLVVFITTIVLGIQYMFVLPEEKSRIKQVTTPYIIGVIIIFGAVTIWKVVIIVLDGMILA